MLLAGCTDPYMPDVITSPPSYLVVDGYLNTQGITTIKLSRTIAVASKGTAPVETRATVYIEDETGTRIVLREGAAGTYTSAAAVLNPARKYRLHLNTVGGREYASDFVPVKNTPPIDNVSWRAESTGLNIYVNAHDANNATQYYRWEYDETWEIMAYYSPLVEYVNNTMRLIAVPFPGMCWGNAHSTVVQTYTTRSLNQDVVASYRLRQLPTTSERLYTRYSILVQQYALTKEEYDYWELLRKNTESIGSLFDPQPAHLTGNVRCISHKEEVVLGFVSAHSLAQSRIFIRRQELPGTWRVPSGYESCAPPDTIRLYPNPPSIEDILAGAFTNRDYLPIAPLYNRSGQIDTYLGKSRDCIDCRTRGTAVKPSYWP
jgi:hypothetical protein